MVLIPAENKNQAPARDFLQSRFWADFKGQFGWSSLRLKVQDEKTAAYEISVLTRPLIGPFSFAYVPHGPQLDCEPEVRQSQLVAIATTLEKMLPRFCLFLRFDPAWYLSGTGNEKPVRPEFSSPLIKAADVQPPDTTVLDLTQSVEELLVKMKPKWRYNIKLAEKKNVLITEESSSALDIFYGLYQQTAARDHIAVHPKSYYEKLFDLAAGYRSADHHAVYDHELGTNGKAERESTEPSPDLRLWVARHEGQAVACIITLYYGPTATYLYGASSDEKRNLMPAYALQWAAIQAAKAAGCLEYDMYGIPPAQDDAHPMAGLYRFKTGFGGEVRHYCGTWDYVYLSFWYFLFRTAERIRLFWHKKFRKIGR